MNNSLSSALIWLMGCVLWERDSFVTQWRPGMRSVPQMCSNWDAEGESYNRCWPAATGKAVVLLQTVLKGETKQLEPQIQFSYLDWDIVIVNHSANNKSKIIVRMKFVDTIFYYEQLRCPKMMYSAGDLRLTATWPRAVRLKARRVPAGFLQIPFQLAHLCFNYFSLGIM